MEVLAQQVVEAQQVAEVSDRWYHYVRLLLLFTVYHNQNRKSLLSSTASQRATNKLVQPIRGLFTAFCSGGLHSRSARRRFTVSCRETCLYYGVVWVFLFFLFNIFIFMVI